MKQTKRILSVVLCLVMVLCAVPVGNIGMKVSAICCRKDYFDKSKYTLTGNMAYDVAMIAKSQKGRTCSDFGYSGVDYGAWCDEYVADCIENAGGDDSIVAHGGTVADFESKMRARGATTVSSPQTGDLVFFTWSHVEIVTKVENGVPYCAGGNNGSSPGMCNGERKVSSVGSYRLFLRPNYKSSAVDLGSNFYAYIIKQSSWKHLENSGSNVQLAVGGNDSTDPKQIWLFTRQSDGSYEIKSAYNDKCIDATNWSTANGANIATVEANGTSAQRWFIKPNGDGYYIQTAYSDMVMDVASNSDTAGTNVELWTKNETSAQRFSIYGLTHDGVNYAKPAKPDASVLSIKELGTSEKNTVFQWTTSKLKNFDSRTYDIRIWKGTTATGSTYKTELGIKETTYKITLPAGTYTANITAVNSKYYEWYTMGPSITFTISNCTHTWNSGTITKSATCSATGVKTFTCTTCEATKIETIEKLKPVDYLNFEKKLKEIAEVDKEFNKTPFELGQQLVALVDESDRPKLMDWLKNKQGCDSPENMKRVFASWLREDPEQKKDISQKKDNGYPPRGEQ